MCGKHRIKPQTSRYHYHAFATLMQSCELGSERAMRALDPHGWPLRMHVSLNLSMLYQID
jgi:hypothetical protein